jgi:hypothetical protein
LDYPSEDLGVGVDGVGDSEVLLDTFEFEVRRAGDNLGGAETVS